MRNSIEAVAELLESDKWELEAAVRIGNFKGSLSTATREHIKTYFAPRIAQVVIDIETLGTRIDSEVIEIGLLGLDKYGSVVFTWEALLAKSVGAHIDQGTIDFHNENSNLLDKWIVALEKGSLANPKLLLLDMFELLSSLNDDTLIWTYGLNFDYPLLQTLALRVHDNFQIRNYRNLRCLRTYHETAKMLGFAGHPSFQLNKEHHALADCFNEAYLLNELDSFMYNLTNK